MRSRSDPLDIVKRQRMVAWAIGGVVIAASGYFAMASASGEAVSTNAKTSKPESAPVALADPFDAKAFDVALWNPSEARKLASGSAAGAASRPATRVQLLGITDERGTLRATLYDPDTDRLWIVGNGDTIPGQRVAALTSNEISLSGTAGTTRIALRKDRP